MRPAAVVNAVAGSKHVLPGATQDLVQGPTVRRNCAAGGRRLSTTLRRLVAVDHRHRTGLAGVATSSRPGHARNLVRPPLLVRGGRAALFQRHLGIVPRSAAPLSLRVGWPLALMARRRLEERLKRATVVPAEDHVDELVDDCAGGPVGRGSQAHLAREGGTGKETQGLEVDLVRLIRGEQVDEVNRRPDGSSVPKVRVPTGLPADLDREGVKAEAGSPAAAPYYLHLLFKGLVVELQDDESVSQAARKAGGTDVVEGVERPNHGEPVFGLYAAEAWHLEIAFGERRHEGVESSARGSVQLLDVQDPASQHGSGQRPGHEVFGPIAALEDQWRIERADQGMRRQLLVAGDIDKTVRLSAQMAGERPKHRGLGYTGQPHH